MIGTRIALAASLAIAACGGPNVEIDGGAADGGADSAAPVVVCTAHRHCDDGVYCNGLEQCRPGEPGSDERGCANGPEPCAASQTCNEAMARCESDCSTNPDADGDGYRAENCGGDDCDDASGEVNPGREEICDDVGRDEDCNPDTLSGAGETDLDGDGHVSVACCNRQPTGAVLCGLDCDDTTAAARPGYPETCDEIDNDCDGAIDERVRTTFYRDADSDLYGDAADAVEACAQPDGYTANRGDCDDTAASVHPTAAESCNDRDDDCDERVDEEVFPPPETSEHCGGCGLACPTGYGCEVGTCVDPAVEVDGGDGVICVRTRAGDVYCWGRDSWAPSPTRVPGVTAVALGVGGGQACAVLASGEVGCWGTNPISGAVRSSAETYVVPGGAIDVAVGDEHACALTSAGEVYCWGSNSDGQLGDGTTTNRAAPTYVAVGPVDELTAGALHTCARAGATVRCWGDNAQGQLGDGTTTDRHAPVTASVSGSTLVGAGGRTTCSGDGDGLDCWGSNETAQAGQPASTLPQTTPASVTLLSGTMTAVDSARIVCNFGPALPLAPRAHTCSMSASARAFCWGDNAFGALGDGSTTSRHQALQVPGLTGVVDLTTGTIDVASTCGTFSCAVTSAGDVQCWGANPEDFLQTGFSSPAVRMPSTVIGFPRRTTPVSP